MKQDIMPIVTIVRPLIAYLSQSDYGQMKMFCEPAEQADIFLSKPLQIYELEQLLKLLKVLV